MFSLFNSTQSINMMKVQGTMWQRGPDMANLNMQSGGPLVQPGGTI